MSDADSLGGFIRRHRHLAEGEAFRKFLEVDAVREWAGQDESRRERLRGEFHRVWVIEAAPGQTGPPATAPAAPKAPTTAKAGPAYAPSPVVESAAPQVARPSRQAVPTVATPKTPSAGIKREMSFMCPSCTGVDIVSEVDGKQIRVRCRDCKREFPNMLELIPVERVGALELVFGGGWRAATGPAAILLALLAVYLLLRWLRS